MVTKIIDKAEEKIVSTSKRLYDWFKSLLKSTKKEGDKEPNKIEEKDKLKELTDRIDQSEKPVKISSVPEEIRSDFHIHIRNMAIAGFNDGVTGIKSEEHLQIAAEKADEFYREFSAHSNGKVESISNEIESKQKVVNSKWQQATLHHTYQNYLQHHYKFNERGNTLAEALLYISLFLIIFSADIPLAIETIKRIYPTFMNSKRFSFNDIGKNWEAFLTALGLAASSIYIKIWYDEFVGKKYGHAVISQKKFVELFAQNCSKMDGLTDEEKAQIARHEKQVKIIKSVILCFTLTVIVVMGVFRKYAWMKSQREISHIPYDILSLAFICLTLLFRSSVVFAFPLP